MGGPKTARSRKGTKAFRKNIDVADVEEFIEKTTHQERRGPAVETLKDEELFFVDTAAAPEPALSKKARARAEALSKPLRSQVIIEQAHKAKPMHAFKGPVRKVGGLTKRHDIQDRLTADVAAEVAALAKAAAPKAAAVVQRKPRFASLPEAKLDIWGDGLAAAAAIASGVEPLGRRSVALANKTKAKPAPAKSRRGKRKGGAGGAEAEEEAEEEDDGWAAAAGPSSLSLAQQAKAVLQAQRLVKHRTRQLKGAVGLTAASAAPRVPALEVDMAGCSYNPDPEQHQDALAALVAAEMKKVLRKELEPTAPPLILEGPAVVMDQLDELAKLQTGDDDDDENEIKLDSEDAGGGSGSEEGDEEGGGGSAAQARKRAQQEKKTKHDRNKAKRRTEQEKAMEESRALKKQRRDLDSVRSLNEELAQQAEEQDARRERRRVVAEEKAVSQPPRLGKLKFEAPAVQVLTSDELTGSLRTLKPCAMLAADRFKALQKRGLIEPRRPVGQKKQKRVVEYEKGARSERAVAGQQEVDELRKHTKALRKKVAALESFGR